MVDQSGIEIDIGIKLAADEIVVLQGDALDLQGNIKQRIASHDIEHFVGNALDDAGTRIIVLIDSVAKAH